MSTISEEVLSRLEKKEEYQRYNLEMNKIKKDLISKYGLPEEELDELIEDVRQAKFKEFELSVRRTNDYRVHQLLTMASINAGTEYNTILEVTMLNNNKKKL